MSKVTKLYTKDAAKYPDNVLEQAMGVYTDVVILGWNKDGYFAPRASLDIKASDILWLLELFKHKLIAGDYAQEED